MDQELTSTFYGEYVMDNTLHPVCEQCGDFENSEFFIKDLKYLCGECVDTFNTFGLPVVGIKNSTFCILYKQCDEKAKWKCLKSGYDYCSECHFINCLSKENGNFFCKPKALFPATQDYCFICQKVIAEFINTDGSKLCHRCLSVNANPESIVQDNQQIQDSVLKLYKEINLKIKDIQQSNQIQVAKFHCYISELEFISKAKYAFSQDSSIPEFINQSQSQYDLNSNKTKDLDSAALFLSKEALLMNLIKNSMVNFSELEAFFIKLMKFVCDREFIFSIKLFKQDDNPVNLVCSQESASSYASVKNVDMDTQTECSNQDGDNSEINIDNSFTPDVNVQKNFFPSGDLLQFEDQNLVTCRLIYFRDPFWMMLSTPDQNSEREEILEKIKRVNRVVLNSDSIHLGMKILFNDTTRKVSDGHKFKRGLIERLPSFEGDSYCVNAIDFGYKLQIKNPTFYILPQDLETPSTVFHARIMGIMPLSKFTFTKNGRINAYELMKTLSTNCKGLLFVKRCFYIGEFVYCKIYSSDTGSTKLIDWADELLNAKIALPYTEQGGCYRAEKNYCYVHHILPQYCKESECIRIHECPFCGSNHKLSSCLNFIEAEKHFQKN